MPFQIRPLKEFLVRPALPTALQRLSEIGVNLLWSWDHHLRALFRRLDPVIWKASNHNPVVMLGRVPQQALERAAKDPRFVALYRRGLIGPDKSFTLFAGFILMIKTQRGKGFLDRVGRFTRFWSWVGDAGVVLAAAAMVTIVAVLALDASVALREPASAAPTAQEALGIPGINPFIPIGYGLVALIIGVVLHEMMHGVIARSQKIGVKSIGILWLVIPVLLLWLSQVWMRASRGEMHDDPVVWALTDKRSLLLGLLMAIVVWLAAGGIDHFTHLF